MDIGKPIKVVEAPAPVDIPLKEEPSEPTPPVKNPTPDREREKEPVPA